MEGKISIKCLIQTLHKSAIWMDKHHHLRTGVAPNGPPYGPVHILLQKGILLFQSKPEERVFCVLNKIRGHTFINANLLRIRLNFTMVPPRPPWDWRKPWQLQLACWSEWAHQLGCTSHKLPAIIYPCDNEVPSMN